MTGTVCHPPFLGEKKTKARNSGITLLKLKQLVSGRRLNPSIAQSALHLKAHQFSPQVHCALGGRGWC